MNAEDKNKLDGIIKRNLADSVSEDFASLVMKRIEQTEAVERQAMNNIFKQNVLESPSEGFTQKVMAQLQEKSVSVYKPIISKKIWGMIILVSGLIFVFTFFGTDKPAESNLVLDQFLSKLNSIWTIKIEFLQSKMLAMSLFIFSLLMGLDYVLKEKNLIRS